MEQAAVIREAYREAHARVPDFNIRELAKSLAVSHGHIQAARLGHGVTGLALTPCDLVMRLPSLGALEVTTTSSHSELKSISQQLRVAGVQPSELSLRMLLPHWYWACLTHDEQPAIEIFDRYGRLLHRLRSSAGNEHAEGWARIRRLGISHTPAFTELVDIRHEPEGAFEPELPHLVDEWSQLADESHINGLLKRHHLRRVEAYAALENRFTQRMSSQCFVNTLERSARAHKRVKLSVANVGAIHQHSGLFGQVSQRHQHIEASGGLASLKIEQDAIAHTWMVTHPEGKGTRTRLEAFGSNGRLIASLTDASPARLPVSTMQAMSVFG